MPHLSGSAILKTFSRHRNLLLASTPRLYLQMLAFPIRESALTSLCGCQQDHFIFVTVKTA